MGTLYILGTPIGNLKDITFRAIDILSRVTLIAAEDTRVTQKLLARYDIKTKKTSFNKDNYAQKIPEILKELDRGDIALTTDAGTPGISDPGYQLVKAADEAGFTVMGIPGPSAVTTILSMCPFPTDSFLFAGFPPRKKSDLVKFLSQYEALAVPVVLFESPKRLKNLLEELAHLYPERSIFVGREMTKIHEETFHGKPADALIHFSEPKGEFTLVLTKSNVEIEHLDRSATLALIQKLSDEGIGIRDISREIVSVTNLGNSEAYKLVLDTLE
ncbi:uncharacterized protein METZ01_LOCUS171050 [marine metagenome]|uniref:Tetrapyrrole methylase domain-containing protein n=1 Tax=marine metagenome TaxID=408172 RepID=A0A382BWK9_9ZZZZ